MVNQTLNSVSYKNIRTPSTSEAQEIYKHESEIQLFDAKTIESFDWPCTYEGQYAKKFLSPMVKHGISHYIGNIHADMFVLKAGGLILPIIVADENYQNSYVCSPYAHYITYGQEAIGLIENKFLAQVIKRIILGIGKIGKKGKINTIVYVNNWLFSTDIYPANFSEDKIFSIVSFLKKRFPDHVIAFRSLISATNPSLIQRLKILGFKFIASRQVYVTDVKKDSIFHTRIHKSDLKLLRESPFQLVDESEITTEESLDFHKLYHSLYIAQHSHLNPQLNERFIKLLIEQRLLQFKVLKKDGHIYGVAGYFERDGIMFCPFFGYEKNDPQHTVIYRLLNLALLLEAKKRGAIFHQSAGASFFKTVRRAEGFLESTAFYAKHLSFKQRLSWGILKAFINTLAPPFMKKY